MKRVAKRLKFTQKRWEVFGYPNGDMQSECVGRRDVTIELTREQMEKLGEVGGEDRSGWETIRFDLEYEVE